MSKSIAEKYSDFLRGSDIVDLFDSLEKVYGSISKAARACGLERRTVYGWKRKAGTENLKASTKRKVVSASLEQVPDETLESILERLLSQVQEILHIYLSTLYEQAVVEDDPRKFDQLALRFGNSLSRYSGLVAGRSEIETFTMMHDISAKANRLGQRLDVPPVTVYSAARLERLLPILIADVRGVREEDTEQIRIISRKLGVTPRIVQSLVPVVSGHDVSLTYPSFMKTFDLTMVRQPRNKDLWTCTALTKYRPTFPSLGFEVSDIFGKQTKAAGATQFSLGGETLSGGTLGGIAV